MTLAVAESVAHDLARTMGPAPITQSPILADRLSARRAVVGPSLDSHRNHLIELVTHRLYEHDPEYATFGAGRSQRIHGQLCDFIFRVEDETHYPEDIFQQLRWGGQFIYASHDRRKVTPLPGKFEPYGFETLHGPAHLRESSIRWIPFFGRKLWYYAARKLALLKPRDISERFTYSVELIRTPRNVPTSDPYVVLKQVPSLEKVIDRLRVKFKDAPYAIIEKRARKFTDKVFPLFLTREAAMLKIMHRDLPAEYRKRVPTLLYMEQDDHGYARKIMMNWMRLGGAPLSQMQFAKQSADLLRVVHERARIIHLDLRLDNFLITRDGVCFVDFGSAVREGENIQGNPLLSTIFEELMRTSQIQRMLYKMTTEGTVTSNAMNQAVGKVDKQVDLFYLAVQINQPLHNPDFANLVHYDQNSPEARALVDLTKDVLKPADPLHPRYHTAAEMLEGIQRVESRLAAS